MGGISAKRFVKNRMLSHAEYERPVTRGTKTAELAGLAELAELEWATEHENGPDAEAPRPLSYSLLATPYSLPYSHRRMMSVALMPPKPKEFERPTSNLWAMALLGT